MRQISALPSPHHRKYVEDLIKKLLAAFCTSPQLRKYRSIPEHQNTLGVAGGKCIMGHHQDRSPQLRMDVLQRSQKQLRRVAVQCSGGFIRQDQFRGMYKSPCTRTALLLSARYLIGIFVQDISNAQLSSSLLHLGFDLFRGRFLDRKSQCNIFPQGQGVQQVEILKNKAQIFPPEPG